jgi:hypothetical protein
MTTYQCYVIDGPRHIVWVTDIECDDDSSARTAADGIFTQRPFGGVELWQNERLVYQAQRPDGPFG